MTRIEELNNYIEGAKNDLRYMEKALKLLNENYGLICIMSDADEIRRSMEIVKQTILDYKSEIKKERQIIKLESKIQALKEK